MQGKRNKEVAQRRSIYCYLFEERMVHRNKASKSLLSMYRHHACSIVYIRTCSAFTSGSLNHLPGPEALRTIQSAISDTYPIPEVRMPGMRSFFQQSKYSR